MKMKMKTKAKGVELPTSLIESEILPRVASKSDIGRCRCVCKQWKSVLSTPTFGRMHLQRHGTTINDYKLLIFDGATLRTLSLNDASTTIPCNPNPNPNQQVFILASLDGLVCLASQNVPNKLVFWNPLTGAYRKVTFDPNYFFYTVSDVVGFYKDSSNDYKLLYLKIGGEFGAYVYSHRLDTFWKIDFEFSLGPMAVSTWSPATLWGQCLYFTVTACMPMERRRDLWIICFDGETETFRKIPFPPVPDGTPDCRGSLVVLSGRLHLSVSYPININDVWSKQCDLWRMDGAGDDGWVKVAAFGNPPHNEFTTQGICTASTGNWLAVLDEENNSFKKVNTKDFTRHYRYISSPSCEYLSSRMIYVETIVSPNP